jgi:hypothetical protein
MPFTAMYPHDAGETASRAGLSRYLESNSVAPIEPPMSMAKKYAHINRHHVQQPGRRFSREVEMLDAFSLPSQPPIAASVS